MTEEEIMEQIKNDLNVGEFYGITEEAIQGLLDLYNKQKEEIEDLKEIDKQICNEELLTQEYVQNNYIKKDKIRHTLLKFQNEYGEWLEITGRLFIGKEVVQYGDDIIDGIAEELDIKLLEE